MALSTFVLTFFSVEILLYVFHLSVLILMYAKRKTTFKGPFFGIFRVVLLADVFCFIGVTCSQKASLLPFISDFLMNDTIIATVLLSAVNSGNFVQYLGHLFLAFNRFTLIWVPWKHKTIWKKQWYILIILGVLFLHNIWRIHESAKFLYGADSIVSILYTDSNVQSIYNGISLVFYFTTTCFAAVFNVLSFVKFIKYKKQTNTSLINVNEKNLLYVSLIAFIAQLLRVYYNANRLLFPTNIQLISFFNTILPVLNGIFAWSGSISLMFLSSSSRKAYKLFYFSKSDMQKINATNSSAPKMFPTT